MSAPVVNCFETLSSGGWLAPQSLGAILLAALKGEPVQQIRPESAEAKLVQSACGALPTQEPARTAPSPTPSSPHTEEVPTGPAGPPTSARTTSAFRSGRLGAEDNARF